MSEGFHRTLYTQCPLCGDKGIQSLRQFDCRNHLLWRQKLPWVINWSKCGHCGHVFTNGYFEGEAEKFLLSAGQETQKVSVNERERLVWGDLIERIAAPEECFYTPAPTWLDVGFGSGGLLMTAAEFGYNAVGLDLREANVSAIQKMGYHAHCGPIESLLGRVQMESYNVISMMDVLEHMPFPRTALSAAYKLLKPDGALVVSCPNMSSELWKQLDLHNQNPYWVEIEHYHNFSRESLSLLLDAHGFSPISYHISKRYIACMELIAMKKDPSDAARATF